jgi:tRNA pseudouridine38-40 synthase
MPRVALGIAYDGANWLGWQKQPGGRTVQDAVEHALAQFLAQPAAVVCAGRTDTGVHALAQTVHLDTPVERRTESWVRGLNALLPSSISIQWAAPVPLDFHARFSALSRTYIYVVRNSRVRSPLTHGRAAWVYHDLDHSRMREAAQRLVGQHDFSCFRSSQCQAASPVRTLESVQVESHSDFYLFTFKANAFLHHMVRNLMGAILYVGQGRQDASWIDELLSQRDRRLAAPTFSPDGLYLAEVKYPPGFGLPTLESSSAFASHFGFSPKTDTVGASAGMY